MITKDREIRILKAQIEALKREIEILRDYGNKDCTAMADAELLKDPLWGDNLNVV